MTKPFLRKAAALAISAMLATGMYPAAASADDGALTAVSAHATTQATLHAGKATKKNAAKKTLKSRNVKVTKLKWTGSKQPAKVKVTYGSKALAKGRDYTLSIKNPKGKKVSKPSAPGTYTVRVKGKGRYKGTVKKKFKVWSSDGRKWVEKTETVVETSEVKVVDSPETTQQVVGRKDVGKVNVWGDGGFWVSSDDPSTAYYPVKYAYDPWHLQYNGGKKVEMAVLTDEDDPDVHKVVLPQMVADAYAYQYSIEGTPGNYAGTTIDALRSRFKLYRQQHATVEEAKEAALADIREHGVYALNGYGTNDEQANALEPALGDLLSITSGGHVCLMETVGIYTGMETVTYPEESHYETRTSAKTVSRWGWSDERYL